MAWSLPLTSSGGSFSLVGSGSIEVSACELNNGKMLSVSVSEGVDSSKTDVPVSNGITGFVKFLPAETFLDPKTLIQGRLLQVKLPAGMEQE